MVLMTLEQSGMTLTKKSVHSPVSICLGQILSDKDPGKVDAIRQSQQMSQNYADSLGWWNYLTKLVLGATPKGSIRKSE